MIVQMVLGYALCTLLEGLLSLPAVKVFDLKLSLVLGHYEGQLSGSYPINPILTQLLGLSEHEPLLCRRVPVALHGLISGA